MLKRKAQTVLELDVTDPVSIITEQENQYTGTVVELQGSVRDGVVKRLVDGSPQCVLEVQYADTSPEVRPTAVELSFEESSGIDTQDVKEVY